MNTQPDTITDNPGRRPAGRRPKRGIGRYGTAARLLVGLLMVGSVTQGHLAGDFHAIPWLLGLVAFPTVLVAWQRLRARRGKPPLRATGPAGHAVNLAVFLVLYLTPWYAPAISATSDAAVLFYGASMLLAAARGYAGCEVTAISNWLARRDDQVGCVLFSPIDHLEATASTEQGARR